MQARTTPIQMTELHRIDLNAEVARNRLAHQAIAARRGASPGRLAIIKANAETALMPLRSLVLVGGRMGCEVPALPAAR